MARTRYGDHNWRRLLREPATEDGSRQVFPRRTICGSEAAIASGLMPVADLPNKLLQPDEYKDVIGDCHLRERFAMYHQAASGVLDDGWNQDGYGFCWAYGLTAAVMDCRALEGKRPVRLAPFSLGWLTDWRNRGYWCDAAIKGARERGIASDVYVPEYELNRREFRSGWEADALNYKPLEWWDTRRESEAAMVQQSLTILATGRALYVAYDWWSHALECVGMMWDGAERHNMVWLLRNSHAERDLLELVGSRGVPDEAYGVRATGLEA